MATFEKAGAGHLGGILRLKTGLGALGSPAVGIFKTGAGIMPLVGSAVDAVEFSKTAAGVYNPFVWMDDGREPASIVLTGGGAVVRSTGSRTGAGIVTFVGSGTKVTEGGKLGTGVLGLVASGVKQMYVPVTYTKTGQGAFTLTAGNPRVLNPIGDARRSIRWLNRLRRRDTW